MRRRCSLCGGKLNGNICTECGLDNSKNDDQYVTLGNSGHEESLTHIHTEAEKPYEGKTMTRENVRKAKNADKNAKKAAAKKASKNAAAGKVNPATRPYSPFVILFPLNALPFMEPRNCFLRFTLFGINIIYRSLPYLPLLEVLRLCKSIP